MSNIGVYQDKVSQLVDTMKPMEQVHAPVVNRFAPGVYIREIFMPAGSVIVGKVHMTEHFNIVLSGSVQLSNEDGTTTRIEAPCTFVSKAGVRKVLYCETDVVWQTIHPTDKTDEEELTTDLVVDTPEEYERRLEWRG